MNSLFFIWQTGVRSLLTGAAAISGNGSTRPGSILHTDHPYFTASVFHGIIPSHNHVIFGVPLSSLIHAYVIEVHANTY